MDSNNRTRLTVNSGFCLRIWNSGCQDLIHWQFKDETFIIVDGSLSRAVKQ